MWKVTQQKKIEINIFYIILENSPKKARALIG